MKYIRIKDDVYCFENNFILKQNKKGEVLIRKPNRSGYFMFNIKDIINQAETIEELIDEYVLREKANCKLCVDYAELTEDDLKLCLQDHDIFGAIWTDKGLIYVAKMNEKGELELL